MRVMRFILFSITFLLFTQLTPRVSAEGQDLASIHQLQDAQYKNQDFHFTLAEPIPPGPMNAGGPAVTGPNLLKEVMGFAPYWNLSTVKDYDFTYISIVAYFGVDIDGNSGALITSNSGWSGWASANRATLVSNAHGKGAKVVLTVKLFDTLNSGGTQTLGGFLASSSAQSTAISQIVSEVVAKGVDGVNVDFEPTDSSSATAGQKAAFATFLTNLTNSLRASVPNAHVSVDTYACAARGATPCSTNSFFDPVALVATPIDTMMVMAYDFYSPSSSIAAPTSPLNGYSGTYWYDVTTAMNDYLAKVSGDKILLGVPYYGIKKSTSSSAGNASSLGNGSNPTYSQTQADISCASPSRDWDGVGKAARIYWYSDSSKAACGTVYNQWRQTYFDDATALGMKYDLVNAKGLRGIGIWALGYDGSYYSDLSTPIRSRFSTIYSAKYDQSTLPRQIFAGESVPVSITVTNTSPLTWASSGPNPFKISYHWFDSRGNLIVWDGNRFNLPADLASGQSVTLTGNVQVPGIPGNYIIRWDMLEEGVTWFSGRGNITLDTLQAVSEVRYEVHIDGYSVPSKMKVGDTLSVPIVLTNYAHPWSSGGSNPVKLSYHWINANTGQTVVWDGARTTLSSDTPHLGVVFLNATISAPSQPGSYILKFDMVKEGVLWFSQHGGTTYQVNVNVSGSGTGLLDATFSTNTSPIFLVAGKVYTGLNFVASNSGTSTWNYTGSNPVSLSYHIFDSRGNTATWDGSRSALVADIPSGNTATIGASLTAPSDPGSYRIVWDMVKENVTWFEWENSVPLSLTASVLLPINVRYLQDYSPMLLPANSTSILRVELQNNSSTSWLSSGANPFRLSYHWIEATTGKTVVWDGVRTDFSTAVDPMSSVTLDATVVTPSNPGKYILEFDLVQENVTWFAWRGIPTRRSTIYIH